MFYGLWDCTFLKIAICNREMNSFMIILNGMWDLSSPTRGIWPVLPEVEVQSFNHWTAMEVLPKSYLFLVFVSPNPNVSSVKAQLRKVTEILYICECITCFYIQVTGHSPNSHNCERFTKSDILGITNSVEAVSDIASASPWNHWGPNLLLIRLGHH